MCIRGHISLLNHQSCYDLQINLPRRAGRVTLEGATAPDATGLNRACRRSLSTVSRLIDVSILDKLVVYPFCRGEDMVLGDEMFNAETHGL